MPEVYRQHFHSSKKKEAQTFTEFARDKEVQFDRCCTALDVAKDYNKLCQIILLEEFKSCLPPHLKTYLDKCKVDKLNDAAVLADDYSLTRKNTFSKPDVVITGNPGGKQSVVSSQTHGQGSRFRNGNQEKTHTRSNIPVCLYCKKRGHIISECWKLEKKKTRSNPVSTICTKQQSSAPFKQVNTLVEVEGKNPFISEGYVSLRNGHGVPIHILRDTGAT